MDERCTFLLQLSSPSTAIHLTHKKGSLLMLLARMVVCVCVRVRVRVRVRVHVRVRVRVRVCVCQGDGVLEHRLGCLLASP